MAAAVALVAALLSTAAVLEVQTRAKGELARSLARETAAKDVALAKEAETQAVPGFVQNQILAAAADWVRASRFVRPSTPLCNSWERVSMTSLSPRLGCG